MRAAFSVLLLLALVCSSQSAGDATIAHAPDHSGDAGEHSNSPGKEQAAGSTEEHHGHAEHHEVHEYESLVFLFCGLSFGTAVLFMTMHPWLHNLQFTVVMFVLGVVTAMAAETEAMQSSGMLMRSFETWNNMDPHLILFVFLPALLFGDAMSIDTHVAKRCAWQCLLLAGPGVILGAGSTGLFLHYALPWGWNLSTSFTVGSILAATDPVAVVGLLKQLGASPSLTIAIQGESLLNDGTAVVLFTVAYKFASGVDMGVEDIASFCLSAVFGAVLIGSVIGLGSIWLIRKSSDRLNHHSPIIQICVTLCSAYWSFLIAEGVFHVSGVLSTVTAALMLAHRMWPLLVAQEAMLEIWHVIETIGNALVFFLAGSMTGMTLLHSVYLSDYLWLLLVYIAITLIRFVMLVGLSPILNRVGHHPLSMKDILVMTWGGLRGMVGLAFAILVRSDLAGGRLSKEDGDRVLFLVGGIAGLTLLINALTCPALVRTLGITQVPEARLALVRNVAKQAEKHVEASRLQLFKNDSTKAISHPVLKYCMNQLYHEVNHHIADTKKGEHGSPMAAKHGSPMAAKISGTMFHEQQDKPDIASLFEHFNKAKEAMLLSGVDIKRFAYGQQLTEMRRMLMEEDLNQQQLKIVREVFLAAVSSNYWDQMKQGKIMPGDNSLTMLLSSATLALDSADHELGDWNLLMPNLPALKSASIWSFLPESFPSDKALSRTSSLDSSSLDSEKSKLKSRQPMSSWLNAFRKDSFQDQTQAFVCINAFIEAHMSAQQQIATFFGEDANIDSPEEAYVVLESQISVFSAAAHSALIDRDARTKVNTMLSVHNLSEMYRNFLLDAVQTGVLQSDEANQILHPLQHEMARLDGERRKLFKKGQSLSDASRNPNELTKDEAAHVIQRWFLKTRAVRQLKRASTGLSLDGLRSVTEPLGDTAFLRQISTLSCGDARQISGLMRQLSSGAEDCELQVIYERRGDDEMPQCIPESVDKSI
eukprot:CAMPEP_0197658826 /NCGR_PEP_ID=MMETSP1338-20131121/45465_1 /TAXON_ID=43686 ORGANISM="Pelagodinium beii, Strain RCC1491" /NCGR_SAMPLE_ID=MMETSP1338 /ASSEMBLY_ACC=CAM_ASM_000754 /LENGTH=987 /DNA_ID=CAMNT_0043235485 /DNA_START=82 /DNA_END=3045 /DNA_ORIENTATION=-